MKTFLAALLIVSTNAFAQELDATEALLQTLPAGTYYGESTKGGDCQVKVQKRSTGVKVSASANGQTMSYETLNQTSYRWNPGQRLFFSSVVSKYPHNERSEDFIRTIAVKENTQYVVVGNLFHSGRDSKETIIECVVNL